MGGVKTPDEDVEETEPRVRGGISGTPEAGEAVSPAISPLWTCAPAERGSSRETSVRVSVPASDILCDCLSGDFSRLSRRPRSVSVSMPLRSSSCAGSAGSDDGVTVLDVASTKSSLSCVRPQQSASGPFHAQHGGRRRGKGMGAGGSTADIPCGTSFDSTTDSPGPCGGCCGLSP